MNDWDAFFSDLQSLLTDRTPWRPRRYQLDNAFVLQVNRATNKEKPYVGDAVAFIEKGQGHQDLLRFDFLLENRTDLLIYFNPKDGLVVHREQYIARITTPQYVATITKH